MSRLFCVGEESRAAADAFGEGGQWFPNRESLAETVMATERDGVTILVKGSRCMGLEKLVDTLQGKGEE